jgi:hypothetical protein
LGGKGPAAFPVVFGGIIMNKIAGAALLALATLLPLSSEAVVSDKPLGAGRGTRVFFCVATDQTAASGHRVITNLHFHNPSSVNKVQVTRVVYYGKSGAVLKDLGAADLGFESVLNPEQNTTLYGEGLFADSSDETSRMGVRVFVDVLVKSPWSSPTPYVTAYILDKDPSGLVKSREPVECTLYS